MSLLLRGYTVTAEQVAEAAEVEVEEDPLDRELDRIRQRRTCLLYTSPSPRD